MDSKKLAWCAVLGGASLLGGYGCGESTPSMPPETHSYVVSTLAIPEPMGTVAAGFNLDDTVSTGEGPSCVDMMPDYTSSTDPMENGVDNALSGLIPTLGMLIGDMCPMGTPPSECLSQLVQQQIAEGSLLLIMEVSDINSFNNDSSVSVQFMLGTVPSCDPGCSWNAMMMTCRAAGTVGSDVASPSACSGATTEMACDALGGNGMCAPMVEGAVIASGQTFDTVPVGAALTGRISGGRMYIESPAFTVPIETADFTIELILRNAEIRANITRDRLSNGAIGGSLRVDDIANAAEMIMMGFGDTARSVLGGIADMEPDSADPLTCAALSAGIEFAAVQSD